MLRTTMVLLSGVVVGGGLGWLGVSRAGPAATAAPLRSYPGSCDRASLSPADLAALVGRALEYSEGEAPRSAQVTLRRERARANLELVEDGNPDDSVRGESRSFELRLEGGTWRLVSCAKELRCYRGRDASGLCI